MGYSKPMRISKNWEDVNESYEGEAIETRIEKMLESGEPLTDSAPLIYTEKANGVMPEYNVRTDTFDLALDAIEAGEKIRLDSKLPQADNKVENSVETTTESIPAS